ncbi:Bgt-20297 [Blumeria graminis f. sp. tritici]|uniref:Bgt-20297 n=5 Tax=Blumeria graminis TaxID=34373 RepID=A0A9X9ME97_BLUGR|nr:Bgt-20297 [Blumeria graminis f. sp. tritici]
MAVAPLRNGQRSISDWFNDFEYSYIYDLESFFNLFLTGCVEYGRDPDLPTHNLDSWCTKNMRDNIKNKEKDTRYNCKDLISNKFSSSFIDAKELAIDLQKLLFEDGKYYYRHSDDPNLMYNNIIMAFNKTIGEIEAGKIPNRTWTNNPAARVR